MWRLWHNLHVVMSEPAPEPDTFLYRSWLVWRPRAETPLWTAAKGELIRTASSEADLRRQVDEYEDRAAC
jgi:hypothetical protein